MTQTGEARDWELSKVLMHPDPGQGTGAVRGPEQSHRAGVLRQAALWELSTVLTRILGEELAQVLAHPALSESSDPQFCTGH